MLVLILSVAYLLIQAAVLDDRSSYPSSVDLPQFHQVEPYLFRGGAPSDNGLKRLKDMGVKTIIDFRVNPGMSLHEQLVCQALGIRYIHLPTGNLWPKAEAEDTFMRTVTEAANDPGRAPVFVHCAHGTDRTGFFVADWRVKHDGWPLPKAIAEMMKYGFVVHRFH